MLAKMREFDSEITRDDTQFYWNVGHGICPSLFQTHRSGWHLNILDATGHKSCLMQWVTQRLICEPRFQTLGPLVKESLRETFSCIEDEGLAVYANNQHMHRTSLHHASAQARIPRARRDSAAFVERVVVPFSFKGGVADQGKK